MIKDTPQNMLLHLVRTKYNLSIKAYNVCVINKLNTFHAILEHYKLYRSFLNLKMVGVSSNKELIAICASYSDLEIEVLVKPQNIADTQITDGTGIDEKSGQIEFYFQREWHKLSARTQNIISIEIKDSITCISFCAVFLSGKITEKDIKKIRNSGFKTTTEIINFIDLIKQAFISLSFTDTAEYASVISNLNKDLTVEKEILLDESIFIQVEFLFQNKWANLSVRTQNVLMVAMKNEVTCATFYNTFLTKGVDKHLIKNLPHIGTKTFTEVEDFMTFIRTQCLATEAIVDKDLSFFKIMPFFQKESVLLDGYIEDYKQRNFPFFHFLQLYFNTTTKLTEAKRTVIQARFMTETVQPLNQIAEKYNLSKERIKQIQIVANTSVCAWLQSEYVYNLFHSPQTKKYIKQDAFYYCIDTHFINRINATDNVAFSTRFYAFILQALHHKYSVYPAIDTNTIHKYYYLINENITRHFNIGAFYTDLITKSNERIFNDYALDFEGYVLGFIFDFNLDDFKKIKQLAQDILTNVFNLEIDYEGNILFYANTTKTLDLFIEDELRRANKPLHAKYLSEILSNKHLKDYSEDIIRSYAQKNSAIVALSRTSTYALKIWETEKDDIKGGSIRAMIMEFLAEFDTPKHIYEILQFVKKYRDTNQKNVETSLKIEEKGSFVAFGNGFYGLSSKDYSLQQTKYTKVSPHITIWCTKFLTNSSEPLLYEEFRLLLQNKYNLLLVQVEHYLTQKVEEKKFILTPDNYILLNA